MSLAQHTATCPSVDGSNCYGLFWANGKTENGICPYGLEQSKALAATR
jgi:hypothetical protein